MEDNNENEPHRSLNDRRSNGQFQKGCSGNPKGRPRKSRSTKGIFQAMLNSKVPVRTGGRTIKISVVEAIAERVKREALTGPLRGLEKGVAVAQKYSLNEAVDEEKPIDLTILTLDELDSYGRLVAKLTGDVWDEPGPLAQADISQEPGGDDDD